MRIENRTTLLWFLRVIYVIFFAPETMAITQDNTLEIGVVGKLITPPTCVINQGKTIRVNFGQNVVVQKISDGQYSQVVPLEVECDAENSDDWMMEISVAGRPANFDVSGATLESDTHTDLGIRLTLDDKPLRINSWKAIDPANLPELRAEVSMRPGATLEEGPFQVTGTIKVEYN
ncbi:fimbrial protein [Pantoea endophytica]